MKTRITFFVSIFLSVSSFSQNKTYYIEIPNKDDIPQTRVKNDKILLEHRDQFVTNIFSKFQILKFEKAFPTSVTPFLQKIYLIEVEKDSDIDEITRYKNYFPLVEETRTPELLYTPNDYSYPAGSSNPHKSLDLINITEAWDYTHGNPKIKIGICDTPIRLTHEDLVGKVTSLDTYTGSHSHGTGVASHAAANTDNNTGIPGTGFNASILFKVNGSNGVNKLLELSQNGARVVNASWHNGFCAPSLIEQAVIDEIYANGTVIIAAAGNGGNTCAGPFTYVYPASYNHVISVSSVGHEDVGYTFNNIPRLWKDRVEQIIGNPNETHQLNDQVDVFAAGFNVLGAFADTDTSYKGAWGTSLSAPQVSGVVALLFSVNDCLNPDEVEAILKLNATDLNTIQENFPYIGKMGAGRIDAGKSTKMAWQMNPSNGGELLVSGRNFDRYHFELINSPQKVRIKDQSFINESDITIKAKDYIILENNVVLKPDSGKSDYLYIADNSCYIFLPLVSREQISLKSSGSSVKNKNIGSIIRIHPNPSSDIIYFENLENFGNYGEVSLFVYDFGGRLIIRKSQISLSNVINNGLSIRELENGEYLIEIRSNKEKVIKKFIKK